MRAFPVLPPVSRRATTGAASLDIRASVGTSTSPGTAISKAVTDVGFQPKAVIDFNAVHTVSSAVTTAHLSIGAGTSASSRAAIGVQSNNAVTTSATNRRHTTGGIITNMNEAGAIIQAADLASLDAGGFTRSFSTVVGDARILNHIALGGADLEVSLVQCQMNGTNVAQSFAHGLSGAPTGVLFLSGINSTAPANTVNELDLAIGAWAGANQFSAQIVSLTGVTTTSTNRLLKTDSVLGIVDTAVRRQMAISSVDATSVNVTYPVTTPAYQSYFWMLCIRGAKCQVGTFDCNGSTSPLTIATSGITPKLFLPVFVKDGVDSVGTVLNDLGLTIGACDGTNHVSCGIGDVNGATTTNARRWQDSTKFCERNPSNGNSIFEATAAFSGESVVLTPTLNSFSNWGQGAYLCVGS